MKNGQLAQPLHSLIPLEDFKALLGIDDREEALCRFCLITATYTIEQYCKRRLFRKKMTDYLTFSGEYTFTLREYPVRRVLVITAGEALFNPEKYYLLPDEGSYGDIPFSLILRPPLKLSRLKGSIRVSYLAGYRPGKAPPDLASACLELAAWSMSRYRGRRIGLTGNVRGTGKDGEHLEAAMPENVRLLLEPYQRRVI